LNVSTDHTPILHISPPEQRKTLLEALQRHIHETGGFDAQVDLPPMTDVEMEEDPLNASFASVTTVGEALETLMVMEMDDDFDEDSAIDGMREAAEEDDGGEIVGDIADPDFLEEESDIEDNMPAAAPPEPPPSASSLPKEMFSFSILNLSMYSGSFLTLKEGLLLVLKFCSDNKVTEQGTESLLKLLGTQLLSSDNIMPQTSYKMHQLIGLEVEDFAHHICINECYTFPQLRREEYQAHRTMCVRSVMPAVLKNEDEPLYPRESFTTSQFATC
jgi:hypothetical protein